MRNIQEAIAEGEYLVGGFYFKRGDNSAAANRMSHLVEQYPLYSKADLALWDMGQAYGRLGNRFRKQEGEAYAKIVRDYPLSAYADDATRKLKELEMPVPEPDKGAVARMQYEKDHRVKPGIVSRDTLFLRRGPDMSTAARSGDPAMTNMRPSVPPLVPQACAVQAGSTARSRPPRSAIQTRSIPNQTLARIRPRRALLRPPRLPRSTDSTQQASQQNGYRSESQEERKARSSSNSSPPAQPAAAQPARRPPAH